MEPEAKAERERAVRVIRRYASARLAIAEQLFFAGDREGATHALLIADGYESCANEVENPKEDT